MKKLLLAAAVAMLAVPAWAFNVAEGQIVKVNSTVLCDTAEQIEAILEASKAGDMQAKMVYSMFNRTPGAHGPLCAYIPPNKHMTALMVKTAGAVEGARIFTGEDRTVYIIEVQYGNEVTGYIMAERELAPPGEPA